jgi:predicted RNA-binding Zn-ribbon protein involved in translation (DUF1610 family)
MVIDACRKKSAGPVEGLVVAADSSTREVVPQYGGMTSRSCSRREVIGEVEMAIKRPTKSRGTPSHKPVASAPLRHVDVRAPQQMVPGEVYVGWLCKNRSCGRVIAIAATALGGKALTDFDDQLTAIKCPHCEDENLYRWSARSEQNYTPKNVST